MREFAILMVGLAGVLATIFVAGEFGRRARIAGPEVYPGPYDNTTKNKANSLIAARRPPTISVPREVIVFLARRNLSESRFMAYAFAITPVCLGAAITPGYLVPGLSAAVLGGQAFLCLFALVLFTNRLCLNRGSRMALDLGLQQSQSEDPNRGIGCRSPLCPSGPDAASPTPEVQEGNLQPGEE